MNIDLYDIGGKKVGNVEVDAAIFDAKVNQDLMHRSVVMRQANARRPIAHTLTRGEVSYSTRKLFRQKGTGRARRGARSTNLLRGGGVTHGPRNTATFAKMMPKKERRAALFSALTVKKQEDSIFALKAYEADAPKTKTFIKFLSQVPQAKRYLLVLDKPHEFIEKSVNNIPQVRVILAQYLNPTDVLWADQICFLEPAVVATSNTFNA
ncbi:MAG TPA: 50S ribosomal protein L4 [Candidatus Gracilibacteria bacterium]